MKMWLGANDDKTHPRGGATRFTTSDGKIVALCWIPKNASTTLKTTPNGFVPFAGAFNFTQHEYDELIVFLRDPFDRWKSGVVQYMFLAEGQTFAKQYSHKETRDEILKSLDRIVFDVHTLRQTDFFLFSGMDHSKSKFYNIDTGGLERFQADYNFWNEKVPHENNSKRNDFIANIRKNFANYVTPALEAKVKEFYKPDYDFMLNLDRSARWS